MFHRLAVPIALLSLSLGGIALHAAPLPCHILKVEGAESGAKTAYELFNPNDLLMSKGIDPARVSGRLDSHGPNDGWITLSLQIDGKSAGYLIITLETEVNGALYPTIAKVEVQEQFQGKGLGSILYIAANRIATEQFKRPLHRSELTSPDAKRTWKRFVEMGYAEVSYDEYGGEMVKFKRPVADALGSKSAMEIFVPAQH